MELIQKVVVNRIEKNRYSNRPIKYAFSLYANTYIQFLQSFRWKQIKMAKSFRKTCLILQGCLTRKILFQSPVIQSCRNMQIQPLP